MLDDYTHITRPKHFLLTILFFLLGGLISLVPQIAWVGWLIAAVGVWLALWLAVVSLLMQRTERIEKMAELYATISQMDETLRGRLGLGPAPDDVRVVIQKAALEGNDYSQAIRTCPLDPARLRIIAANQLGDNPTPFTIREWTPLKDGKLLSDPDWRRLTDFLRLPDPETPALHFIEPKTANVRDGFDWTDFGRQFLKAIQAQPMVRIPASIPRQAIPKD